MRIYIDSSVISYLAARPSRDVVALARQQQTSYWWEHDRSKHELFASRLVAAECRAGDATAAAARLQALEALTDVEISEPAVGLAEELVEAKAIPTRAAADALHLAVAAVHRMDVLLT